MKYARFIANRQKTAGIMLGEDTFELIEGSILEDNKRTGKTVKLSEVEKYLPPVDPPNIFAIGKNYAAHAREFDNEVPEVPVIFMKATTSVTAHDEPIVLPRNFPDEVDYEAELAVIIGRTAKHVSAADALDYVFGYTCGHDVSQRKCQKKLDGQWTRGKGFDTFCPLGPVIETELDPSDIRVRMRLNGETMQDQSTCDLMWSVPRLIELLSDAFTLLPGTVIMTGTPAGVGGARTPPVYLKPGDVTEIDVEGIGILRNTVAAE